MSPAPPPPPPDPPPNGRAAPTVHVVDDDPDMRDSLAWLIESVGLRAARYESAGAFLARLAEATAAPGCVVSDVRMPGMSGLDLQEALKARGAELPVIFVTAHADVPMAVRAMQSGAAEFVEKPFNRHALLERVQRAVRADMDRRTRAAALNELRARLDRLTPGEREALEGVKRGLSNRAIAERAGVSVRAVEMRRSGLMKKLGVESLAELLRLAWVVEGRGRRD